MHGSDLGLGFGSCTKAGPDIPDLAQDIIVPYLGPRIMIPTHAARLLLLTAS